MNRKIPFKLMLASQTSRNEWERRQSLSPPSEWQNSQTLTGVGRLFLGDKNSIRFGIPRKDYYRRVQIKFSSVEMPVSYREGKFLHYNDGKNWKRSKSKKRMTFENDEFRVFEKSSSPTPDYQWVTDGRLTFNRELLSELKDASRFLGEFENKLRGESGPGKILSTFIRKFQREYGDDRVSVLRAIREIGVHNPGSSYRFTRRPDEWLKSLTTSSSAVDVSPWVLTSRGIERPSQIVAGFYRDHFRIRSVRYDINHGTDLELSHADPTMELPLRNSKLNLAVHSPCKGRVSLKDLSLGVIQGQLYAYKGQKKMRILPDPILARELVSSPVYRLLSLLVFQEGHPYVSWSWGSSASSIHLPRIQYKRIVLSSERWRIPLPALLKGIHDYRWRKALSLPANVLYKIGPENFRINLSTPADRKFVLETMSSYRGKSLSHVVLEEDLRESFSHFRRDIDVTIPFL